MKYNYNSQGNSTNFGDWNPSVAALQQQLNEQNKDKPGYKPLTIDSKYGPLTKAAFDLANTKPAVPPTKPATPTPNSSNPQQVQPVPESGYYPRVAPTDGSGNAPAAGTQPQTEADVQFQDLLKNSKGLVDAINQNASDKAALARAGNAGAAAAGGLGGSTAVNTANMAAVKPILDQRELDLQTTYSDIRTAALEQAGIAYTHAQDAITAMAKNHLDWNNFKQTNPNEYNSLVTATGGNPNITDAMYATSIPPQNVVNSWVSGSTYSQLSTDPVTGKPSVQTYDLGVQIPQSWTQDKIGTNAVIYKSTNFNPLDPSTFAIFGVNPLTGIPTGQISGNSLPSSDGSASSSSATPNYLSILNQQGVTANPSDSLATFISDPNNMNALVQAAIKNEGGTPQGTNNPGNVEFANQSGATQGSPKPGGGYWANFDTPQDGLDAIASTYENLAKQGLSVGDAIDKYTGTGSGSSASDSNTYGLLGSVKGFNPQGSDGLDKTAANYIEQYISQGKLPTASSLGISTRSGSGGVLNTVADRARTLYKEATGQNLPNFDVLQANTKLITQNNSLLNSLGVQEGTVSKNFNLNIDNMTKADLNSSSGPVNAFMDTIKNWSGNPDVAQYLAQNTTVANELGSLLAVKNATGTTVHDKLESSGLVHFWTSAAQQKKILTTLVTEAQNAADAINEQNSKLYKQVDPLGQDPNNPINQPKTDEGQGITFGGKTYAPNSQLTLGGVNLTVNSDGTMKGDDGNTYSVDAQGNVTQQ